MPAIKWDNVPAGVRIQALGGYRIFLEGRDLRLRTRKEATLLLRLGLAGDDGISRDECIGLLWPESSEAKARHSLSEALRGIELATGVTVDRSPDRLVLPESAMSFDLRELDEAVADGAVHDAARLYNGGFLAGWYPPTAEASHWVDGEAAALAARLEKMLRRELAERRQATDSRGVTAAVELLERMGVATEEDRAAGAEAEEITTWETMRGDHALGSEVPFDREGPFVGRKREMKVLTRELDLAAAGQMRVALMTGEPGIGKTRTSHRLARIAAIRGARLFLSTCFELEKSVPYQAICDAFGEDLSSNDMAMLRPEHRRALTLLLREGLTEIKGADHEGQTTSLPTRAIQDALVALVQAAAGSRTVIIHIDDLQWADSSSCQALHYLLRKAKPKAGALLLFSYRSDEVRDNPAAAALLRSTDSLYPARVILDSLAPEEARMQLEQLWPAGGHKLPDISALAGGNPFYARELALAAASRPSDEPAGSLSDAILSRADALNSSDRTLVDLLSVWGSPATLLQLSYVVDQNPAEVARAATRLRRLQLVRDVGSELSMAHDLTRSALYHALSEPVRASLHGAIAITMEASSSASFLAHHFSLAGERTKAYEYAVKAARDSRKKKAYLEELRWLVLALNNADIEIPETLNGVVDRLFTQAQFAEISRLLTAYSRFLTPLLRMKADLAQLSSAIASRETYPALIAACDRLFAVASRAEGAGPVAVEALRAKMKFAQEVVDTTTALQTADDLSAFGRSTSEPGVRAQAEAISLIKLASFAPALLEERMRSLHANRLSQDEQGPTTESMMDGPYALNEYNQGRISSASAILHRMLKNARENGSLGDEVKVRTLLVPLSFEAGRFGRALRHANFIFDCSRFLETWWERWMTITNVATCHYEMSAFDAARLMANKAIAAETEYPMWLLRVHPVAILGLCAMQEGDFRTAMRYRDRVEEILPPPPDRIGDVSHPVLLMARTQAHLGDLGGAAEILVQAESSPRGFPRIYHWNIGLEWSNLGLLSHEESLARTRIIYKEATEGGCRLVAGKASALLAQTGPA